MKVTLTLKCEAFQDHTVLVAFGGHCPGNQLAQADLFELNGDNIFYGLC